MRWEQLKLWESDAAWYKTLFCQEVTRFNAPQFLLGLCALQGWLVPPYDGVAYVGVEVMC